MNGLQFDFIDIRSLSEEEIAFAIAHMSEAKRARTENLACPDDRLRSAAAEHLARRMLAGRFGLAPENICLDRMESGQPTAVGLPCHISLSHSGRWAMCAVCDVPVGADIEVVTSRGERTVSRICTDAERGYIFRSGDFDRESFFRVWTAKEAVLKRQGVGIAGGLSSTVVADENGLLTVTDGVRLLTGSHADCVYSIAY